MFRNFIDKICVCKIKDDLIYYEKVEYKRIFFLVKIRCGLLKFMLIIYIFEINGLNWGYIRNNEIRDIFKKFYRVFWIFKEN